METKKSMFDYREPGFYIAVGCVLIASGLHAPVQWWRVAVGAASMVTALLMWLEARYAPEEPSPRSPHTRD